MCYWCPRISSFTPGGSTPNHFESHTTPNDPKLTLNNKRSKVPPGRYPIFALRPAVFELQSILRQMYWMTPKWRWTIKGQRYSIFILQLPLSPNFHRKSPPNDHKMNLNTTRSHNQILEQNKRDPTPPPPRKENHAELKKPFKIQF